MKKRRGKLRLYVWENVLCDYTCGVMFALAYSMDEARELCKKSADGGSWVDEQLAAEPVVHENEPYGLAVWGGG